jgi:flagellar motility protein MotE (MotC chaperone)
MIKILPLLAFLAFAAVPLAIGNADTSKSEEKAAAPAAKETSVKTEASAEEAPVAKKKVGSDQCLASEEVIQDLEAREQKLKTREAALREREKELESQQAAIKEQVGKLDAYRAEVEGEHAKELAEREEKVNKLIETFESMSPKSAAGVIGGVDDELAVTALSRLTSTKAGKILANLKPDQSARLSEMMAYGKASPGKEKTRGESERAPASKR